MQISARRPRFVPIALLLVTALPACGPVASPARPGTAATEVSPLEEREETPPALDALAIAAGGSHVCVVGGGRATCWGTSSLGEVRRGSLTTRFICNEIEGAYRAAAGQFGTCVATADHIECWGWEPRSFPSGAAGRIPVTRTPSVDGLAVGLFHACFVRGGEVSCWGSNTRGEVDGQESMIPVDEPRVFPLSGAATVVRAAGARSCALVADGDVFCWGLPGWGEVRETQAASVPVRLELPPVRDFSITPLYGCALDNEGAVWCWGRNTEGQVDPGGDAVLPPTRASWLPRATQVSAGVAHACALGTDGSVTCWGANGHRELGCDTPTSGVCRAEVGSARAIAAGPGFTCAITDTREPVCWGALAEAYWARPTPVRLPSCAGEEYP